LRFIKNVTSELCYGGAATNIAPNAILSRMNRFGQPQAHSYSPGLFDMFTALSTGQINIYTAKEPVLHAALGGDGQAALIAQQIVSLRGALNDESAPVPTAGGSKYMSPVQLLYSAGVPSQAAAQQMASVFGGRSYTYKVTVDAEINGYHRFFIAVLGQKPNDKDIKVLNFYWRD